MIALVTTSIILVAVIALIVISHLLIKEEDLIKKAEKNWFYHTLAKMTSPKYDGYVMGEDEQKSMAEYLSKTSEYDRHPIGSYFKMRNELNGILKTAGNFHGYKLSFNLGEVGTGVAVMLVFVGVVTLGVVLC